MRFGDFLKATVLLSAAAATALAAITVLAAASGSHTSLLAVVAGWWVISIAIGLWLGRRHEANPPISRLLSEARAESAMPEHRPGAILLNRLWPLLGFALIAGILAFVAPQIPGIGAGFAIIWALAWRRQERAVAAIEERDGVRFYVRPTSPIKPMELQRTPGFKAMRPESMNGATR